MANPLSKEDCEAFFLHPNRNPQSGKLMARTSETYKRVEEECSQYKKKIAIYIFGAGCTNTMVEQMNHSMDKKKYGMDCVYLCNDALPNVAKDIIKRWAYMNVDIYEPFVLKALRIVIQYLNDGYIVHLIGHSYGGSVVSRISVFLGTLLNSFEEMNNTNTSAKRRKELVADIEKKIQEFDISFILEDFKKRIYITTLGSIFVPKPKHTRNLNIKHLMFINDVVLKTNTLTPVDDRHVVWLVQYHENHVYYVDPEDKESEIIRPQLQKKYTLIGTLKEWEIHNDYDRLLTPKFFKTYDLDDLNISSDLYHAIIKKNWKESQDLSRQYTILKNTNKHSPVVFKQKLLDEFQSHPQFKDIVNNFEHRNANVVLLNIEGMIDYYTQKVLYGNNSIDTENFRQYNANIDKFSRAIFQCCLDKNYTEKSLKMVESSIEYWDKRVNKELTEYNNTNNPWLKSDLKKQLNYSTEMLNEYKNGKIHSVDDFSTPIIQFHDLLFMVDTDNHHILGSISIKQYNQTDDSLLLEILLYTDFKYSNKKIIYTGRTNILVGCLLYCLVHNDKYETVFVTDSVDISDTHIFEFIKPIIHRYKNDPSNSLDAIMEILSAIPDEHVLSLPKKDK